MACLEGHTLPVMQQDILCQVEGFGDATAHGMDPHFAVPAGLEELLHHLEKHSQSLAPSHIDLGTLKKGPCCGQLEIIHQQICQCGYLIYE